MKKMLVLIVAILLGTIPYAFATPFHIDGPSFDGPSIEQAFFDILNITLSHGGTFVLIYNGVGDNGGQGTADAMFKPFQPLSLFHDHHLTGNWTLSFLDLVEPNDEDNLLSLNIEGPTATTNPVPEPATMLLVGSGLIGLAGYGRKKFFKK